ncbi:MAG: hypothetical protein U0R68_05790 [Candidatus Nanopelagicales bacterium]
MHRSALVRRLVVVASMVVLVGAAASPAEALTAAPTITVTVPPQPITSTRDVAVTYQVSLKPTDLKLLQCGLTAPGSTVWIQKTCGIRTDINRKVTGSINFQGVPDGTYDVVVRAQGKTTALGEKRVRIQVAYVAPSSVPAQACAPYGTFLTGGDMSAFPPGSGFDDATYSVRWRCSGGASTFQSGGVLTSAGMDLLLVCLQDGGDTAIVWPQTGPQVFYCLNLR